MNDRLQKNCFDFFLFYDVIGEASIMRCPRFVWEKKAYL